MLQPKISLFIPFKNTENFLSECLESIIEQEYTNWEVIAVDDNSTDKSLEIVTRFSKIDTRIKVFRNPKTGLIPALQLAYQNSTGEYLSRMDSDDIMMQGKLQHLIEPLIQCGLNHISTGKVKYFSAEKLGEGFLKYQDWLNALIEKGSNFTEIYKECVIPSPCWMMHRKDFDKVGGFNSEVYPEDYDLTFRCYEHDLNVIPSQHTLHLWRDYPVRASRTDANYAFNTFIPLKLHYFLKLERDPKRELIVWGAGKKGKQLAEELISRNIEFIWICDNPKKIGKDIYGKKMCDWKTIEEYPNAQSIITVASPDAQIGIKKFFNTKNKVSMKDYYFFC